MNSYCMIWPDNSYVLAVGSNEERTCYKIYHGSVGPGLRRKLRKFGTVDIEIVKRRAQ